MLSLRQVLAGVGLYAGLLVTAALVLNLRYKPMAGDTAYLDTWTGKIRTSAAVPLAMAEAARNAPQSTETSAAAVRKRRRRREGECARAEVMRASESLARARASVERYRYLLRDYRRERDRIREQARRAAESAARARIEVYHPHTLWLGTNEYTAIRFAFPAPKDRVDR